MFLAVLGATPRDERSDGFPTITGRLIEHDLDEVVAECDRPGLLGSF
jgi:hypothetical protein